MVKYCIYKITNKIDDMAYVGQTPTHRFKNRMKDHKCPNCDPDTLITKAIVLNGWENFDVKKLVDNVPEEDVDENYYIQRENTMAPHGYNQQRGDGSGTVSFDKRRKKWVVKGPGPEYEHVGYYDTKKKANEAADLFRRTGERMESDIKTRKKGTGTINVTKSGRFSARITIKGETYRKTFDTRDECEVFFIRIKNIYS